MTFGTDDLPALHALANRASLTAQRRYFAVLKGDLAVLVIGATVGAVHTVDPTLGRIMNGIAAVLFGAGFVLTLVLLTKNYDRVWYGGRAAAESVKTLAWRYATKAAPFHEGTEREVDDQFGQALRSVMAERDALNIVTEDVPLEGKQITDAMRALRKAPLSIRLSVYLNDRVDDQRRWYASKSAFNAKREQVLFVLVLITQAVAGVYAIVLVAAPSIELSLTGTLTTIAAGLLVWMQAKQYQELAQSYVVAANELSLALDQGAHVESDAALSQFVSDTESAVSREHTLWAARRDRLPRLTRL